jgi:hypothetical protein
MQEDKIFNNSYGESDLSEFNTSFKLEAGFDDSMDPDDQIHHDLMMRKLDSIIKKSEFKELNKITPDGVVKKLNKMQINKVFSFAIGEIGNEYTKVELFGALSDYFDVFPNKFYNSLSNKYKDELISELDRKYNILEKRNIRKLF